MNNIPRVAYFPDTFLEVDGLAMTSRRLVGFAATNQFPMFCVHAGPVSEMIREGRVSRLQLKRSPLAFPMDEKLRYDPLFHRYARRVRRELLAFKPDVVHITGLNDVSIMGAYLAWKHELPLVGSWHTNVHEFAGRRLVRSLSFLPGSSEVRIARFAEKLILDGAILYYKMPKLLMAPNSELAEILEKGTKRKTGVMLRGVDTEKFAPQKRTVSDGTFRLGYVGRLRAEKNVRLLARIESEILRLGPAKKFEFLIVGEGNEREWLEEHLKTVVFTGFLSGDALSEAYANMDVFVFPSETDSFGNVVQEAAASGVPSLVTDKGGPKFLVEHGRTGFVCTSAADFGKFAVELMDNRDKLLKIKEASRELALARSWDSVFTSVYDTYRECIELKRKARERKTAVNR